MAEDLMVNVYKDLISKSDPVRNILTGYEVRRKIEDDQFKREMDKAKLDQKDQELSQQFKIHREDLMEKVEDRFQRGNIKNTEFQIKGLELDLKEKDLKQRMYIADQKTKIEISKLYLRNKEFERKIKEDKRENLTPILTRLQYATSEANNLRDKAFGSSMYLDDDQRAAAQDALNLKLQEVQNITDLIDRQLRQSDEGMGATDTGSLTPKDKRPEDQKARDGRVAETEYQMNRVISGANVPINTNDSNPQVAAIKREAAAQAFSVRSKTLDRINDIKKRYYKELETDPYADPPFAKIETLLYEMKRKIQGMKNNNKYLKDVIDESQLDKVLYGD